MDAPTAAAPRPGVTGRDWDNLPSLPASDAPLPETGPDEIGYLQYSSGSTRFPHGVAVTHRSLLDNLHAHGVGLEMQEGDRVISWLPWYHDMGLVGCFLSPVANQVSTDYLKTEDFARRPLAWLDMISRTQGTTLSYSPPFGHDICARRLSSQTKASDRFDRSRRRAPAWASGARDGDSVAMARSYIGLERLAGKPGRIKEDRLNPYKDYAA